MSDTLTELTGTIELKPLLNGPQADSAVMVNWCLSKQLLEELAALEAPKPMLLITILHVPTQSETRRYLVPLALGKTYISFKRAGINRVLATPIWVNNGDKDALERRFLQRDTASWYTNEVLRHDRSGFIDQYHFNRHGDDYGVRHPAEASFELDVSDKMFAKPPRQWWVEFQQKVFRNKPYDECHSWQRALFFGWWAVPLFLLVNMPLRWLFAAVRTFFGVVPTSYKPLVHPFRMTLRQVGAPHDYLRSFWFCKKERRHGQNGMRYAPRNPLLWVFNPPVQTILIGLVFLLGSFRIHRGEGVDEVYEPTMPFLSYGFWETVVRVMIFEVAIIIALAAVVLVAFGVAKLAGFIGDHLPRSWRDSSLRRQRRREAQRRRKLEAIKNAREESTKDIQLLTQLVCGTDGPSPVRRTDHLPVKLRAKLVADENKIKHCRPYQG